ncbi:MAG: GNAT family N-acetyltransferase [Candidatus Asgardarchaeia archaeon]
MKEILVGNKVILRALEDEDAYTLAQYVNDLEVIRYLSIYRPHSTRDELEFIETARNNMKRNLQFTFGIVDKESKKLIGVISLNKVNWVSRTSELGIAIWNKAYWGRGYGTEALTLILDYGFNFLNLHKIWLRVFDFNKRAIRAYEKVGFVKEGVLRKHVFKEGRYADLIIMGILRDEFLSKKKEVP